MLLCCTPAHYFYPRPPGGGRQKHLICNLSHIYFYPRPPGGGRPGRWLSTTRYGPFLSTPSGWRATARTFRRGSFAKISIHALRVEGDECRFLRSARYADFYPRPPGGGRPPRRMLIPLTTDFYPRPPGGGRQNSGAGADGYADFYPRPPGGGRPYKIQHRPVGAGHFYPRPPGGGRPQPAPEQLQARAISIHALRVEGDQLTRTIF